jgi:Protein of unknown function (DUF2510)
MDPAEHKSSGWYPDPSNSSIQRWWNGISWGDQTRHANGTPIPTAASAPTPSVVDPYAPVARTPPVAPATAATRDGQFRNVNPIGYAGVALGFVSLLFNVFCVPSGLAIIFSAIGLNNARKLRASGRRVTGWNWCIAGLVLGIVETAIYLASAVK